jgi:hypothetical protein
MQQFIEGYSEQMDGVLTGFDRLVFRGSLRRLNYGRYDSSLKAMVATGWRSISGRTRFCSRTTGIT